MAKKENISWNKGKKLKPLSEEHKKKISESLKGKHAGKKNPFYNKKHSEKTKREMSESRKGRKNSFYGKHHSQESKEKNRQKHLGKKASKKTKLKMSKTHLENPVRYWKGKKLSEEHKLKLSEFHKKNPVRYWEGKPNKKLSITLKKLYKSGIIVPWNKGEKGLQVAWNKGIPATRKQIKILKENRKNQIFPKKDSKIEIKIQNFLKKLRIEFLAHQYMNIKHGYQCDLLIPSMNLVVECDGNYWHKYPIGREIDYTRTKELIEKGFNVLRLWESEIKSMNINEFKNLIKWKKKRIK